MKAYVYAGKFFCSLCHYEMSLSVGGQNIYVQCNIPTCPNNQKRFEPPTVELKEL